jgi:hypothetical protein
MKSSTVKGLVHLGLTLFGAAEALTAKTGARKFLLGTMVGFHAHATMYHFFYEDEDDAVAHDARTVR